ncbi:translin-associated factor X-interacting protein 1 isoform X3 [Hemibagrus wyckioides]|uniref:translin-associated factor X-interacting protein 1 isoform X3 n=1 Tax=Hemibagrus wyckioides TaxID=337641 RepID=UPI00266DB3B7|nr:translin-associated factor X-interacting protein 1 isoform X3 [Hemibagrus wyckioides]
MSIKKDIQLPPLSTFESRLSSSKGTQGQVRSVSKILKVTDGCCSGYLSTWPAHVSSQVVQQPSQKHICSGANRNHGEEFGRTISKPRFLEQLECYLRRELASLDMHSPKIQQLKLQAYREVFDYFIEGFKTYKPLLSAIKNEYEITLVYLQQQIQELEPLRAQMVLLSEQCEEKILGLREQERAEITALKQQHQHLQQVVGSMKEQQRALQTQVSYLEADLARQYVLYREERDARRLLIDNISSMSYSPQEPGYTLDEDPVNLKLALEVCREDLNKAQTELNHLLAEYGDVVPRRDWENLERMHQENLLKLETLQSDFNQLKTEYDTLLNLHQQISTQRNSLHRKSSTPRPQWEQCADIIGSRDRCSELFEGQSSQKRLEILLKELSSMGLEQKDFFTGLGTSNDVPIYLRYEGQLRNLRLKKTDVVRVLKDIWREKASEDEKTDERSDLKEFLHRYLLKQHEERAGQWAYSLLDGIKSYAEDDFIGLFYDILQGKVDESVYRGQTHLLSHLLKVLIQGDSTESGFLSTPQFSEALRTAFPLKGDQDIEELVQAAQSELQTSGGNIAYQRLYTEDTDGKQSDFLGLVKKQAMAERRQYISQLGKQLGGKGEVGVEDLRAVFNTIDPTLDSETLDCYLSAVFQTKDLRKYTERLDTDVALQRLSAANVNRAGPMPELE